MQTLDGVLCHNGEFEQQEYKPKYEKSFDDYDTEIELCYTEGTDAIKKLIHRLCISCDNHNQIFPIILQSLGQFC